MFKSNMFLGLVVILTGFALLLFLQEAYIGSYNETSQEVAVRRSQRKELTESMRKANTYAAMTTQAKLEAFYASPEEYISLPDATVGDLYPTEDMTKDLKTDLEKEIYASVEDYYAKKFNSDSYEMVNKEYFRVVTAAIKESGMKVDAVSSLDNEFYGLYQIKGVKGKNAFEQTQEYLSLKYW